MSLLPHPPRGGGGNNNGGKAKNLLDEGKRERKINSVPHQLFDIIDPDLTYDIRFNKQLIEDAYSKLSISRDLISTGSILISKGELVDDKNFQELESLKLQYDTRLYTNANTYWILFGYSILVGLTLMMLMLFNLLMMIGIKQA